jgi:hypothetical protein
MLALKGQPFLGTFAYAAYVYIIPESGHDYDTSCWIEWATYFLIMD